MVYHLLTRKEAYREVGAAISTNGGARQWSSGLHRTGNAGDSIRKRGIRRNSTSFVRSTGQPTGNIGNESVPAAGSTITNIMRLCVTGSAATTNEKLRTNCKPSVTDYKEDCPDML
jgi:hypothetical protein